jgi:flagellar hook-basal body complex protein FliE
VNLEMTIAISGLGAIPNAPMFQPTAQNQSSAGASFAENLFDVMRQAESTAIAGINGQIPMQDAVLKVMEAERTFAAAMAIKDKAVNAYLELSRMQI